jgi:hypothetical protein
MTYVVQTRIGVFTIDLEPSLVTVVLSTPLGTFRRQATDAELRQAAQRVVTGGKNAMAGLVKLVKSAKFRVKEPTGVKREKK